MTDSDSRFILIDGPITDCSTCPKGKPTAVPADDCLDGECPLLEEGMRMTNERMRSLLDSMDLKSKPGGFISSKVKMAETHKNNILDDKATAMMIANLHKDGCFSCIHDSCKEENSIVACNGCDPGNENYVNWEINPELLEVDK